MNKKKTFEVREIDAWRDADDSWYWNESFHIKDIQTSAKDLKRRFLDIFKYMFYSSSPVECVCEDGYIYEIRVKKDEMPIVAFIEKE